MAIPFQLWASLTQFLQEKQLYPEILKDVLQPKKNVFPYNCKFIQAKWSDSRFQNTAH